MGNEANERIISTRIQQFPDKIYSGFWLFQFHSEMQWGGPLELVSWVYVASVVREDVFQHGIGFV